MITIAVLRFRIPSPKAYRAGHAHAIQHVRRKSPCCRSRLGAIPGRIDISASLSRVDLMPFQMTCRKPDDVRPSASGDRKKSVEMTKADPSFNTFEYVDGQRRDTHPDLLARFEARSLETIRHHKAELDVNYGSHPRQKLDVFFAQGPARGAILYFHPGYWQSRDKSTFRFLAMAFTTIGYDFILANYPLCPDVRLDELVDHVAESIPFSLSYLANAGSANGGLIVAGHSAGGHLAVEMALRTWPTTVCNGRPVQKIVAISGVYELVPLVSTPLNDKLQLSDEDARANSPAYRVTDVGVPGIFVVGSGETSEFRRQSRNIHDIWRSAGNQATYVEVPEADHFSVVSDLSSTQIPTLLAASEP